jgi:uroporphyrinogen-III synthase
MQKNKIHILSTRPLGEVLLSQATQNNIIIDEVSFINILEIKNEEIEQKIDELIHQKITAVFTSRNAVEAVAKFLPEKKFSWKIFCTGNSTKKMAKKIFGKENICATADGAEQLAERITGNSSIKNVVFFCGDQRRNELPVKLKKNGIAVEELIVYKTIETPRVILKQYDGILFFSPSAVQSFFSKNSITGATQVFAIGTTTASTAKLFTQQPVIVSGKPGKKNLVILAIKHFSKTKFIKCNP